MTAVGKHRNETFQEIERQSGENISIMYAPNEKVFSYSLCDLSLSSIYSYKWFICHLISHEEKTKRKDCLIV